MRKTIVAILLILLLEVCSAGMAQTPAAQRPPIETNVGMTGQVLQVVLPGPELIAKPAKSKDKVVLRVVRTYPHGELFRYDLEYQGFEPGEFNLAQYLQQKDGAVASGLPAIPIKVTSVMPPGQTRPNVPRNVELPRVGGYRMAWIVGGVLWLAGLFVILYMGRKKAAGQVASSQKPRSLAERLRPLVEQAIAGKLSRNERAQLELSLITLWTRRLSLGNLRPAEALAAIRAHKEAGPLILGLEEWLHRPDAPKAVDVSSLLAPYVNIPQDAFDEAKQSGGAI